MKSFFSTLLLLCVFTQLGCEPDKSVDIIKVTPSALPSIEVGDGTAFSAKGVLDEALRLSTDNTARIVFISENSNAEHITMEGGGGCGGFLWDLPVISLTRQGIVINDRELPLDILAEYSRQWGKSAQLAGAKLELVMTAEEGVPGSRLVEVLNILVPAGITSIRTREPQDESVSEQGANVSTEASKDFELGLQEMEKGGDGNLDSAHESFIRVINQYRDKQLTPRAYLNLGRVAVKQKKWKEGVQYFGKIINQKKWLDRQGRAESNYNLGLCIEHLGKPDKAIDIYHDVILVYGSYVNWSSQALERGFELAYRKQDRDIKIRSYSYLRRVLYMLQLADEEDAPSGGLRRARRRLPNVIRELKLTPEELVEIDKTIGIIPENE